MTQPLRRFLTLFCALTASCSSLDTHKDVDEGLRKMKAGPTASPRYNATNFSAALACMDRLLLAHQIRDATFVVEDLADSTGKLKTGSRDMLISAVSEMSRRSRAIQLNAYGTDTGNLIGFLERAQRRNPYSVLPQYDVRGSVTQLDESVAKKQADIGLFYDPSVGIGVSKSSSASILALDLSIVDTNTLNVIPGVVSKNTVVIYKDGKGLDSEANYRKLGINYSMSFSVNEGQGQALRNLIELGSIELLGRLLKLPYWTCLGADADSPEVAREIEDWFYAAEAHDELPAFVKNQLRLRGLYTGPVDDKYDTAAQSAVLQFKRSGNMTADARLDLALFKRLLAQPVARVAASTPTAATIEMNLGLTARPDTLRKGTPFEVVIQSNTDSYLYCFYQDDNGAIQRFYPNRFTKDPFLGAGRELRLPGTMPFKFHVSKKGMAEKIACYATGQDILSLVEGIRTARDFETLRATSLRDIGAAIAAASGQRFAGKELVIKANP
jgi:hypothetical protein